MGERKRYTVIHTEPIGYRVGQYIAKMRRVETTDLRKYLDRNGLDATHIFEGWPRLEGRKGESNE